MNSAKISKKELEVLKKHCILPSPPPDLEEAQILKLGILNGQSILSTPKLPDLSFSDFIKKEGFFSAQFHRTELRKL